MKNFLIPTKLHADTISAVEMALQQQDSKSSKIILLFVSCDSDAITSVRFLNDLNTTLNNTQEKVLIECQKVVDRKSNYTLEFQHQFELSSPLLKNILNHYSIDLILLPSSVTKSKLKQFLLLTNLLYKQNKPILHLNNNTQIELNTAVYLENIKTKIPLLKIQNYVLDLFSVPKIHEILQKESDNTEFTAQILADLLSISNCDFVIETRKTKNNYFKKTQQTPIQNYLNIPVLSLCETCIENSKPHHKLY